MASPFSLRPTGFLGPPMVFGRNLAPTREKLQVFQQMICTQLTISVYIRHENLLDQRWHHWGHLKPPHLVLSEVWYILSLVLSGFHQPSRFATDATEHIPIGPHGFDHWNKTVLGSSVLRCKGILQQGAGSRSTLLTRRCSSIQ